MLYLLILVFYTDAADVQRPDLEDTMYAHGTLKVDHVDTVTTGHVDLYFNRYIMMQTLIVCIRVSSPPQKPHTPLSCQAPPP